MEWTMKSLLRSPEELLFTAVAYSLLGVVVLCFFTVRWTKESYARLEHEPSVLRVFPTEVVPGATQRVTVLSRNTHFGPESTVRSRLPGVALSGIRFVSDAEFSFEIFVHDGPGRGEGLRVPIAIRSPREGGSG